MINPGNSTLADDVARLTDHYTALYDRYGDSPQAAQWSDQATQERRMEILAQVGDVTCAKILDFGCGTGRLLDYLIRTRGFAGEYVGYELIPDLVAHARATRQLGRFEVRNVLADGVPEDFDYIVIGGVFNNRLGDNKAFMAEVLRRLFPHARCGLAFNALSTYVDYFDPDLFYMDPGEVFELCKQELSPRVALRHDYEVKSGVLPFEFTVYVYKSPVAPRRRLHA